MTTMHTHRRTTAELIAAARALQVLPAPSSPAAATAQSAPALAPQATADETGATAPQVVHPPSVQAEPVEAHPKPPKRLRKAPPA